MMLMSNTLHVRLRRLAFLALLSVYMAVPGCATTSTPDGGTPSPTQVFGTCSTAAIKTVGESLVGAVTTAMATGNPGAAVAALLGKYTADEIGCGVDLVVSLYTKKASRTNDTETQVVLAHAQAWRQAHPAN